MPLSSRIVAMIVLVAAFPVALVSGHSTPQAKLPPCHGHMPVQPAPVSYQCCINGHQAAIPQAMYSPHPLFAQLSTLDSGEEFSSASAFSSYSSMIVIPASSPPGIAGLRI